MEKYYRIGEFAELTGLSVTTLRYYDDIDLLNPSFIDPYTNYRYYTAKDLEKVEYINNCKNMGFSLEEIVEANLGEITLDQVDEKISELEERKAGIENQLVNLQEYRALRKKSVKVLRKEFKKQDKVAC